MPPQTRVGDNAKAPIDGHGCPSCPHPVEGPATTGSPNVLVNGSPAMRLGDGGVHSACCGQNKWTAVMGSATVMINKRPAVRKGDMTVHCGGVGTTVQGSPDVIVGG